MERRPERNDVAAPGDSRRIHAVRPRVNALHAPLGIDTARPEFSWYPLSDASGVTQSRWRVEVAGEGGFDEALLWDSGEVDGDRPFGILYDGPALTSMTGYQWRVLLRDSDGETGGWSEPAVFETAMLGRASWSASWVSGADGGPDDTAPLYLRGVCDLPAPVSRARAYVSALGWYRFFANGEDLTGTALVPRWTPLGEYVEYQTYDLTEVMRRGRNVIAMAVADGRYRGANGFFNRRASFGDRLAGFVQLVVDLADGTRVVGGTDANWVAGPGRILRSDPKYGERADLRRPEQDWLAGEAPERFTAVETLPEQNRTLVAQSVPPVTAVARLPATTWRSPSGKQLVDLGQNIAGVLRIHLHGRAGTTVRMTFGEVLTPNGEFDPSWIVGHQRPWVQQDEVTLDGSDTWWQPWFTIHGFRYVQVEGLEDDLGSQDVEGIVLSSDLEPAGSFTASDERLSRLWRNVFWSARSNFTDTATDCPTRERSGWTGDIQVFAPAATGILDSQAFLRRYLRNVAAEQRSDGNVPPWVPSERTGTGSMLVKAMLGVTGNAVGWGDVTTMTPWAMWRYYGDRLVLERQYVSMCRWVDGLERRARHRGAQRWFAQRHGRHERYILDRGFQWGEWLRPGERFPSNLLDGTLHGAVVGTAYFEHSARILADVADVLQRPADAGRYRLLANRARAAWRAAFLRDGGSRIGTDRQDDYVRALAFGLLDPEERPRAADRLVEHIEQAGGHLGTGFLSTPLLLDALADHGHADAAFRLLFQDTAPSWLYQVERGATTPWETWDGYGADGYAHDSHNHYALGSVVQWLRERVLGMTPLAPGYRRMRIHPLLAPQLQWAEGTVMTPYGLARSRWDGATRGGRLVVTVPTGSEAEIITPDGRTAHRESGTWTFVWSDSRR